MTVRDLIVELQQHSLDAEVLVAKSSTSAWELAGVIKLSGKVLIDPAVDKEVEIEL